MTRKTALTLSLMLFILPTVSLASCAAFNAAEQTIKDTLQTIGYPIGLFMMVYMGIKWAVAEGPEDRENARRGIIYVVIGLLMLRVSYAFVIYLMCVPTI